MTNATPSPLNNRLLSEIEWSYARSSGPGGQNVNKVNSKAVLRWPIGESQAFSQEKLLYLISRLQTQLTVDGDLVISSDRLRDQIRNREDCLRKLEQLLIRSLERPKVRKKTKPSRSSRIKKQEHKKMHSKKKALRKNRNHD